MRGRGAGGKVFPRLGDLFPLRCGARSLGGAGFGKLCGLRGVRAGGYRSFTRGRLLLWGGVHALRGAGSGKRCGLSGGGNVGDLSFARSRLLLRGGVHALRRASSGKRCGLSEVGYVGNRSFFRGRLLLCCAALGPVGFQRVRLASALIGLFLRCGRLACSCGRCRTVVRCWLAFGSPLSLGGRGPGQRGRLFRSGRGGLDCGLVPLFSRSIGRGRLIRRRLSRHLGLGKRGHVRGFSLRLHVARRCEVRLGTLVCCRLAIGVPGLLRMGKRALFGRGVRLCHLQRRCGRREDDLFFRGELGLTVLPQKRQHMALSVGGDHREGRELSGPIGGGGGDLFAVLQHGHAAAGGRAACDHSHPIAFAAHFVESRGLRL